MPYLRDPKLIYEKSFATVRAEANLTKFSKNQQDLVIRLIHACGMVDIVDDLSISPDAVELGEMAIASGAPIICDVNMVVKGIISRMLTKNNPILCGLQSESAKLFAQKHKTTKSAGGIASLGARIEGAVIAIGNAPTALFHLLEMLEQGGPKPALILGFPVGFVGAVESKEALILNSCDIPFIALRGRRGGSAFASAAVNALATGLKT